MNDGAIRPSFSSPISEPIRFKPEKYHAKIQYPLCNEIIQRILGKSWNPACPIPLNKLAYIQLTHWDFNGKIREGELIVHQKIAEEITEIFEELFLHHFPIEKLELIDNYEADDLLSMSANNSSAFCSRLITGSTSTFSKHSYGTSIDINPRLNPYVNQEVILPQNGSSYVNREFNHPGKIDELSVCYQAFHKRGYVWGGNWDKPYRDYHHFEKDPNLI